MSEAKRKQWPGLAKIKSKRLCLTPGCQRTCRSIFGSTCKACYQKWRLNGDVRQRRLTVFELRPYLTKLRYSVERRKSWTANTDRLIGLATKLGDACAEIVGNAQNPNNRVPSIYSHAASLLQQVLAEVDPVDIARTVVALHLLRLADHRRFVDDACFAAQVGIRVIAVAPSVGKSRYWSTREGRMVTKLRTYNPRYMLQAGLLLNEVLAAWVSFCVRQVNDPHSATKERMVVVRAERREKRAARRADDPEYGVRVLRASPKQLQHWRSGGTFGQMWERLKADPSARKARIEKTAAAIKAAKKSKRKESV